MSQQVFLGKAFLIFVSVFLSHSAFSQKNYLGGYVVQSGDTLHGFIDYRNWRGSPDLISFKRDLNGQSSEFQPLDIDAFGVLDEVYISAVIETDISPHASNLGYELSNSEVTVEMDTAFLQALVKGSKSLYFFENRFNKSQFYIKSDSSYDLLIYKNIWPFKGDSLALLRISDI